MIKVSTKTQYNKLCYYLGQRDMMASVLAEGENDGEKYPKIAKQYEELFKEKHFSHDWHTIQWDK